MGRIPSRSTNPDHSPHFEYLNEKDFQTLSKYKHSAPKTIYEKWMINNVLDSVEKQIPSQFNPNAITWTGNVPMVITSILSIYHGGLSYHEGPPLPSWVFLFTSACILWFSYFDCLDGMRARRL